MTAREYRQRLIDIVAGGGHTMFDSQLITQVSDIPSESVINDWLVATGANVTPLTTNDCVAILRRIDGVEIKIIVSCIGNDAPQYVEFQNVKYGYVRFLRSGKAFYQQ